MEIWNDDQFDLDLAIHINETAQNAQTVANEAKTHGSLIQLYLYFLFMFQTLFRLSDTALDILLKFLSTTPSGFTDLLPNSIYSARKMVGNQRDNFNRYVCCPKCQTLYSCVNDCVMSCLEVIRNQRNVQFPSHPQTQHRQPCNAFLMKKFKSKAKNIVLYPQRIYCYKSVAESLQEMLKRPDFFTKCDVLESCVQEITQMFMMEKFGRSFKMLMVFLSFLFPTIMLSK